MFRSFIHTSNSFGLLIGRLILAGVIWPHGAQKLLGLFGGNGYSATVAYFSSEGIPAILAVMVILAEFFGTIALAIGFFGRFMAFSIFCVMIGAIMNVHAANGFFMNWNGQKPGEGFEYHLLAIAITVIIMVDGSGRWSVDRALSMRDKKNLY